MNRLLLSLLLSGLCIFASAQVANRYDVVISEIMADPTPQVGLPANEWIELKNVSSTPINLQNWRLVDESGQSGPMPNFVLQPDSFVIVCTSSAVAAMTAYGRTISVSSFPSLDNDGELIALRSPQGASIHSVNYSSAWYQNAVKREGGWTLEMTDTRQPCLQMDNWKASIDQRGGTPGSSNSVTATITDQRLPALLHAYVLNASTIALVFDEPLDSLRASNISNYILSPSLNILSATPQAPLLNTVFITTATPLLPHTIYTIKAMNLTDCKGNAIGVRNTAPVGLPQEAKPGDVVINEMLFNPKPTGYDYVEIFNRSNKIIDLNQLYIANRNSSNAINSLRRFSETTRYLFPSNYVVITEDAANLALHFFVKDPEAVIELSSLPSFPDDEGNVVVVNAQGEVVDEVNYEEDWHFALIANEEGVALERINTEATSQDATNWHSAASTAGYGTPGYQNSQLKNGEANDAAITISPKIFSPDNDGRDDVTSIQYTVAEPGFVANITIFDAAGRQVRKLVSNGTMGRSGSWNWDGLGEKSNKLPVGTYIIYTELFNLSGKKKIYKNTVVLARKLN